MASEWTSAALAEISSDVSYGYTESANFEKVGPRFLRITDIQNGIVNWAEVPYCPISREHHDKYKLHEGDIVVARTGNSTGENFLYQGDEDAVFASYLIRFRIDQKKADPQFVWYNLRSRAWWDFINNSKTGSAQAGANAKVLGAFTVHQPPLPEQRAIAHILGTLDDKIELNRHRNQTLETMARALFKDWFVDFGPVRAKSVGANNYSPLPADLWQLFPDRLDDEGKPEGWETQPLDKIADFLNGLALQKFPATDADDSLPVIKIAELRNGISATSDRASRNVPAKYIIKDRDFLFSWSGSLLARFWTEGEGALNQHLFKVTSERYPMWFVSYWVLHHLEEFQAIAAAKATTMGHIQRGHLKAAITICPPDEVVERMCVVMAPLVEQSIQNELESRTLAQLRDTLLPKLISGELRIKEAERFLERVR